MFDWKQQGYRVTSPYGYRDDPFNGNKVFHTGIDLVKAHKAPIFAFVGGEVVHAREGQPGTGFGGFGIVVAVKDERGALHCYAHLDSSSVRVGQKIGLGQEVGKQGTTGRSTGSHLHYEIRLKSSPSYGYGSHTDPSEYLSKHLEQTSKNQGVSIKVGSKVLCTGTLNDGTVTAPIRVVVEALGGQLMWHPDGKYTTVNGKRIEGEHIINGQAFGPVRAVSEALGANVVWDQQNNSVKVALRG
ncbi:peptidoglycan DD-metalloendopeptidase family protein [Paenibacillus sp. UMB4589-SE434]|uniref:peptidoglycan DD-metalloendopeptidase family protein n=1 Tax=Paenibacillus sp. UMB4589-SE434 TaxID=3046314 RepID=UPI00254DD6EF|nr:peptidoglycan DD-metalloendopeptidase family protein [Paenibacillus sp. UMB4589-SE434]MDK8182129.1 peptidoglycan DD-metalloendopeptidase family protein [Paenibacillus sp. UMB4589-SE434]